MPDIKDRHNFEPSVGAKKGWLATRKEERDYSGVEFPGLFSTSRFTKDSIFMLLIAIGEMGGASMIIERGGFVAVWVLVPLAIILDVAFALFMHRKAGLRCEGKNRLLLLNRTQPVANDPNIMVLRAQYEGQARSGLIESKLFALAIIIIALLKAVGYLILRADITILVIAMGVLYLLVAVGHIKVTGYWAAEVYTGIFFRKESEKHAKGQNLQWAVLSQVYLPHGNNTGALRPAFAGMHRFYDDQNQGAWCLEARGLLLDDDLNLMANQQVALPERLMLATLGLQLQLNQLSQPPGANPIP